MLGAHLGPHCWPAAIRMIESGRLPMDQICTHQLPLAEFQRRPRPRRRRHRVVKVSLIPLTPRSRPPRTARRRVPPPPSAPDRPASPAHPPFARPHKEIA